MINLRAGDILFVRVLTEKGRRPQLYTVECVDETGVPNGATWSGAYVTFQGLTDRYSASFLAGMPENRDLVHAIEHDTRADVFVQVQAENRVQLTVRSDKAKRPVKKKVSAVVDVVED